MNRQTVQEAAEWFVELNTGDADPAIRQRFDVWLRASPEHVRAFLEMVPIWEDGSQLPVGPAPTPEKLIEWARAGSNVVSIEPSEVVQSTAEMSSARQRWNSRLSSRKLLAACLVVLMIGVALTLGYRAVLYPTYTTGVGEQHSLALADGSTIELNARSSIRVRYSANERRVDLLEGQALFHVAKNAARPFVVRSGETQVRAVGTQFDVYRRVTGTTVTVVEGTVAVIPPGHPSEADPSTTAPVPQRGQGSRPLANPSLATGEVTPSAREPGHVVLSQGRGSPTAAEFLLAAGEQVTVTGSTLQKTEHANVTGATAWTQRQLVFDHASLTEVAEEFNRYNTRPLTIDTAQLTGFRLSGIFSSSDPSALIRFLREQPGVRVVESDREIHISHD